MNAHISSIVVATAAVLFVASPSLTFADQCTTSNDCVAGEVCVYSQDEWGSGENVCKSTDDIMRPGLGTEHCGDPKYVCKNGYLFYVSPWQTGTGCRVDFLPLGGCGQDEQAE
jgi:hypothetical protein